MAELRFPKMHIATSVMNRILNLLDTEAARPRADGLPRYQMQGASAGPIGQPTSLGHPRNYTPVVPDPTTQGKQLDEALAQPTPEVGALGGPESDTANAAESVLSGGTSLQGLLGT